MCVPRLVFSMPLATPIGGLEGKGEEYSLVEVVEDSGAGTV